MKNISSFFFLILMLLAVSCNILRPTPTSNTTTEQVPNYAKPIELSGVKIRSSDSKPQVMPDKQLDILHTDLDIKLNWGKHECIGKAAIRLKPYFYEVDSIVLDAHHMVFDGIQIFNQEKQPIEYLVQYNQHKLVLKLEQKVTRFDTLELSISYIAHPDDNQKKEVKPFVMIKDFILLILVNLNPTSRFNYGRKAKQKQVHAGSQPLTFHPKNSPQPSLFMSIKN